MRSPSNKPSSETTGSHQEEQSPILVEPHTPGPWVVEHGTWISTEKGAYDNKRMHVADIRGWGHLTGTGGGCAFSEKKAAAIQDANAALIAAAPDLLAACRAALAELELLAGYSGAAGNWPLQDAVKLGQRAIAKAEGRSNG